jgi:AraC family transcriptional activator of mtrCDE
MDAVSHLLRLARVDASLDRRCLLAGSTGMDVAAYGGQEAPFHVLLEGNCLLRIGAELIELRPGDVVVIASGAPHRITTAGHGRVRGITEKGGDAFITTRSTGGGTAVIDLFCGHFTFGGGAGSMLFRSLPDPMHVHFGQSVESDRVLRMLSDLMRGEAQQEGDGTAVILSALSTVILAMVLRSSRGTITESALWTAATDARIAALIEAVLDDPGGDWSINRPSRAAAMSRASFLRRFKRDTGMTVGAFLTQARLMTAAELLNSTDLTIAAVAARVGYQSESAFSRSFARTTGATPARFRRASDRGHTGGASRPNPA